MSTKSSRSSLAETPSKSTPATPRMSRVSRGSVTSVADSPSLLQNSRRSVDKFARSAATSKSSVERCSSKLSTLPDIKADLIRISRVVVETATKSGVCREAGNTPVIFWMD